MNPILGSIIIIFILCGLLPTSQGVDGDTLLVTLAKYPERLTTSHLCPKSLSVSLVLAMLLNPEDGKPDNYIVESLGGREDSLFRLVSIDNDHAFVPAVPTGKDAKSNPIRTKCVLFCMDAMHNPVHDHVRKLVMNLDPYVFLKTWLLKMIEVSTSITAVEGPFTMKDVADLQARKENPTFLCVPIRPVKHLQNGHTQPGIVMELYNKLQRMQRVLAERSACTHFELLETVEPALAMRYREVLFAPDRMRTSLTERFERVDGLYFGRKDGAMKSYVSGLEVMKRVHMSNLFLQGQVIPSRSHP